MTWHNVMLYSQSQKHGYNWVSLFWVNIKIYITKLLLFLRTPLQDACGQKWEGASGTLRGSKAELEMKLAQISNTGERCSFQFVKCHWSEMFPRAVMPYNFLYFFPPMLRSLLFNNCNLREMHFHILPRSPFVALNPQEEFEMISIASPKEVKLLENEKFKKIFYFSFEVLKTRVSRPKIYPLLEIIEMRF